MKQVDVEDASRTDVAPVIPYPFPSPNVRRRSNPGSAEPGPSHCRDTISPGFFQPEALQAEPVLVIRQGIRKAERVVIVLHIHYWCEMRAALRGDAASLTRFFGGLSVNGEADRGQDGDDRDYDE